MTEARAGDSYRVELPDFEGPLDLLLHLCKTHEIDIVKLPIAFVTEKYLEYLDVMQTLSVDLAADYLVMAATLAYLKSRELVPAPEPLEATEEEGDGEVLDPREELIRRLLEYQKYKNAAALLGERPIEGRNIFGRGMDIEGDNAPTMLADHSVWKLIEAFGRLLEKAGPKVTHEVAFDRVSIGSRINQLIDRLELQQGVLRFDELFDLALSEPELRSQLVVTLLAILELARLKVVRVLASEQDETLIIAQVDGARLHEARRARVTSDTESLEVGELTDEVAPDESSEAPVVPDGDEEPALEPGVVEAAEEGDTEPLAGEDAADSPADEATTPNAAAVDLPEAGATAEGEPGVEGHSEEGEGALGSASRGLAPDGAGNVGQESQENRESQESQESQERQERQERQESQENHEEA